MKSNFPLSKDVEFAIKTGKLGYNLYKSLLLSYGKRGEKAFFYLRENRIKKYKDFFVVVGEEEYVVEEDHCNCKDFQMNLRSKSPCTHILAVKVAEKLEMYDTVDTYYVDFIKKEKGRK
ncbi:MAG: SWIM zinc finger family protein [Archaeoglobaceae archaeon]